LNLSETGVSDAEIAAILKCSQLRSIDLCSTQVTPNGVQGLLELPNRPRTAAGAAPSSSGDLET
jgi:hypothetical protein